MAVFDPGALRVQLIAEYGVSMMLTRSFDEVRSKRTLGHFAMSCLNMAVEAALCGLDAECEQLLDRASDWLDIAVAAGEIPPGDYRPNIHEARTRHALAVTNWLRTSALDHELLASACSFLAVYFAQVESKREIAHNLPTFVLANRWQELAAQFEGCASLGPLDISGAIRCPGKMSYLFAQHKTKGVPEKRVLQECFERFMSYQMPVSLGIRRNGLGSLRDVPTWCLIEELTFADKSPKGPATLRRALKYV
jgi:hypothetical protein